MNYNRLYGSAYINPTGFVTCTIPYDVNGSVLTVRIKDDIDKDRININSVAHSILSAVQYYLPKHFPEFEDFIESYSCELVITDSRYGVNYVEGKIEMFSGSKPLYGIKKKKYKDCDIKGIMDITLDDECGSYISYNLIERTYAKGNGAFISTQMK